MAKRYPDPTREELDAVLNERFKHCSIDDFDAFDREAAIYWFAAFYHGGLSSNLYSVLSQSEYNPGPCENGPRGYMAQDAFDALVDAYGLAIIDDAPDLVEPNIGEGAL